MKTTLVTAATGWSVVLPVEDNGKYVKLLLEPVLSWALIIDGGNSDQPAVFVHPVTIEGLQKDAILQRPDGSFFEPYFREFSDRADVLEFFTQKYKESQK